MKKLISLLLALALMPCGVFAMAQDYDGVLDAAFEAGQLSFAKAALPEPDAADCELIVPEGFWERAGVEPMDEAALRALMGRTTLRLYSFSPDGIRAVGQYQADELILPVVVSAGRVAVIVPATGRGVEDAYGVMDEVYRRFFLREDKTMPLGLGFEGAAWSPSGRYLWLGNNSRALNGADFEAGSPFIVDTETGELFALDSFDTDRRSDETGCWVACCFSEDESRLYAMCYGKRFGGFYGPLCYSLEGGEAQPLGDGTEHASSAALYCMKDGSLLTLSEGGSKGNTFRQGLVKIAADGTTEATEFSFDPNSWSACRVEYSAESGWAIIEGGATPGGGFSRGLIEGFQCVRVSDSLTDGADIAWFFPLEGDGLASMDHGQINEMRLMDSEAIKSVGYFKSIIGMCLSPDGRYAAIIAGTFSTGLGLYVVRLEDMAVLRAQGFEAEDADRLIFDASSNRYMMNWSEAGLLVNDGPSLWKPDGQ